MERVNVALQTITYWGSIFLKMVKSPPWEKGTLLRRHLYIKILQEERKLGKMHENSHPGEVCRRCGTGGGSQEQRQVALKKSKLGRKSRIKKQNKVENQESRIKVRY